MAETSANPLVYYSYPGLMTDPGEHVGLLKGLPAEIPALARIVHTNLLHIFWAQAYNQELSDERKAGVQLRRVSTKLAQIKAMDDRLLTVPRSPEKRLVGNCRDFSVLMVALLQHQGIPARARCGFGTYFVPDHFEDHWVAEYWNADERRWVLVDAQLDELQCKALNITFDPCDVPRDQFITGGQAWQMCRSGQADPDKFGIFDMHGLWFVRGDMLRDLAALHKMELLPWDSWGVMIAPDADSDSNMTLMDRAAELTLAGNEDFADLRAFYEEQPAVRVPEVIHTYPNGPTPLQFNVLADEIVSIPTT